MDAVCGDRGALCAGVKWVLGLRIPVFGLQTGGDGGVIFAAVFGGGLYSPMGYGGFYSVRPLNELVVANPSVVG